MRPTDPTRVAIRADRPGANGRANCWTIVLFDDENTILAQYVLELPEGTSLHPLPPQAMVDEAERAMRQYLQENPPPVNVEPKGPTRTRRVQFFGGPHDGEHTELPRDQRGLLVPMQPPSLIRERGPVNSAVPDIVTGLYELQRRPGTWEHILVWQGRV